MANKTAGAGDTVEIILNDGRKYSGTLMPSPEVIGGKSLIVKLSNGYNVGLDRSKVKKVTLIKVAVSNARKPLKLKENSMLPHVSILSTGGTISCKVDYKTGGVFPDLSAEDFIEQQPLITKYANYDFERVSQVFSEDLGAENWQTIAKATYDRLKKGRRGVIITHGTDTLAYSAAMLSFMVQKLPAPVVFVGAQRSVDRGSSDSFPNLLSASIAAAKWDGAESVICMHESSNDDFNFLIRGNKARKMHTERRDAFRPINTLPLARINAHGDVIPKSHYQIRSDSEPKFFPKLEKKVALIQSYPGAGPDAFNFYVESGYRGIVIASTGLGHVPQRWVGPIKKAVDKGVPVVMTSQCLYGRTNPYVYSRARELKMKSGAIYGEDMLPETAYVKLMHVLGQTRDSDEVETMMTKNIAGEISTRIPFKAYLN